MVEIHRTEVRNFRYPSAAEITDVKHLASYNWIEAASPTIVVPGSPALWAPPGRPTKVNKDSGLIYINQNAARHPDSPLEPLFLALYATHPSFDISSIDVVTDRNNLRKLFSIMMPGLERDGQQPFTIEVEIHKNTALFGRVEESNQETIPFGQFRGFGHEFEKVYTRHQINGSTGHHRIVSYRFGGMSFIVRNETDGFVKPRPSGVENDEADELSGALQSLSLASNQSLTDPLNTGSKLVVRREGVAVPLSSTLEIKTRAIGRSLSVLEVAPQIWLSQTPKLVRAYHKGGLFQEPQVEDVTPLIQNWQATNQEQLQVLAGLIRKIVDVAKSYGNRATVRYVPTIGKLTISPFDGKKMLPDNLYLKWETKPAPLNATEEVLAAAAQPAKENKNKPGLRVQVGETTYEGVDLKVMPYFKTYFEVQLGSGLDSSILLKHPSIPFFDEVVRGLAKGPREFFRILPTQLSTHRALCSTLKLLGVNVVEGRTLRQIMDDFRSGKPDFDTYERREISGDKSLARDSAFRLLYMFLSEDGLVSETRDKPMAYNAAFFVVSHPRMFHCRTRKMVRSAYDERFGITDKQRANLDKWPLKSSSGEGSEDDGTTPYESAYSNSDYWDSDYS